MSGHIVRMKLPITSCPQLWPLNHLNSSAEGCSSLMRNLMHINCSTYPVILNVAITQYTCSLSVIYRPHWLNTVKSSLFTHAHSSPLSSAVRLHQCHANCSRYINSGCTFFLDRPRTYKTIFSSLLF